MWCRSVTRGNAIWPQKTRTKIKDLRIRICRQKFGMFFIELTKIDDDPFKARTDSGPSHAYRSYIESNSLSALYDQSL
jgi:hypothetical protein